MVLRLQTGHHLKFQSSKGGCTDSSESTPVKIPHNWKSHDVAIRHTTGMLHVKRIKSVVQKILSMAGHRCRLRNILSVKLQIFSYLSVVAYILGAQKNRLIETVLLSTRNALLTKVLHGISMSLIAIIYANCYKLNGLFYQYWIGRCILAFLFSKSQEIRIIFFSKWLLLL